MFTYKGVPYRKIIRKVTLEVFTCQVCKKGFYEDVFYRSGNLCYICADCMDRMVKELNEFKSRKPEYYREKARKFLSQ